MKRPLSIIAAVLISGGSLHAVPEVTSIIAEDVTYPDTTTKIDVSVQEYESYFITNVYVYAYGPGLSGWVPIDQVYIGATSGSFSINYTPPSTGTYYVTAEAENENNDVSWPNPEDSFLVIGNSAPSASLDANNSYPEPGQTITLTGSYSDTNSNLFKATIRDLGSGYKSGDTGAYPAIGTAGDSISGSSDFLNRNFTFPSNTPFGSYTFRTEVVDTENASDISWLVVTVGDYTNPDTPTGLGGDSITLTSFRFDWSDSYDEFGIDDYHVQLDSGSIISVISSYHVFEGLSPGTTYTARVRAEDTSGNTSSWATIQVTTVTNTAATVTSFTASDSTPEPGQTITLTGNYSDSTGNLNTATIRDLGSGDKTNDLNSYPAIGQAGQSISGGTAQITRDFTVPSGTPLGSYTFRTEVSDTYGAGDIEWLVVSIVDTTPPGSPTALQSSNVQAGGFTVSWTASTDNVGVTGYKVRLNGGAENSTTETSYTFDQLTPNTSYLFEVRAHDSSENYSGWASTNVTTLADVQAPTQPAGLQISNATDDSFTLTWTASTDNVAVTGYEVRLNGGTATAVTGLTHTFTGLTVATNYTAEVRARDSVPNWSTWASIAASTHDNLDTDDDGMPDWWEDANTLDKNSSADASQDADGDGLTNLQEYLLQTDPNTDLEAGSGQTELKVHTPNP